jgi:hypothetical protein
MDEATAFAAGHRPCFECGRSDYNLFKFYWLKGNPEYEFNEKISIQKIDAILQQKRITRDKSKVTYNESIKKLPDGAFFVFEYKSYLLLNKRMYLWSPFGYGEGVVLADLDRVEVLTPKSTTNAFKAGV